MIKKFFKALLWLFVLFIAVDVGAVLALPHLVPMDKVAGLVRDQVREQTGRDLMFSGAELMFWPDLGVSLKDVTFSNPVWAQQKNMVSLGKADVAIAAMPLLDHHIVIKKFILNAPDIYLETSSDGRHNWDLQQAAAPAEPAARQTRKSVPEPAAQGYDLQFGKIEISKGKLTLSNQQKKTTDSVSDVDISVNMQTLKSPLRIAGALTYRGKRITLDAGLDRPLDFFEGRSSSGQVSVKSDDFAIKADGALATQGTYLKGDMEVSVPALSRAVAWAQNAKEERLPFEKLSFTSAARLTQSDIVLDDAVLGLDDVQAKGNVSFGFSGKPNIVAKLSLNKLNLDRFTGGDTAAAGDKKSGGSSSSGGGDWDTKPIDFSGLKAVNADLKLQTQGFTLKGVEVGPSTLTVQLQNSVLNFKSSEATLFGGKFSSSLGLNAASATPTQSFSFSMAGVQAQPVLSTFANFKKLSGAATAHVSVTSAGSNQKAIISSLQGKGDFDFKNGVLEGIDMIKIAQLVQRRSTDVGVNDGSTQFVDLAGTFAISRGIAANNDMKMTGAVVRATGQGTLDLPRKYIQYRVIPTLVTSTAPGAAPGISIPVNIQGPFSNIKVVPDFASTVRNIINDPTAAKGAAKNVRDNIRDIRKDIKQNPGAAIQNLLGGGIGGLMAPQQQQQPAPVAPAPAQPQQQSVP